MKAWIASLVLFLALIALMAFNANYVHRVSAHVCATADALSFEDESTANTLDELEKYWQQHRPYLALSISYRDLDHLCEALISLRSAYDMQNASDFELYRRIVSDSAAEIARLEKFSVENLLETTKAIDKIRPSTV